MAKRRGNLEGSIYQLPSGKWRAQINIHGTRLSQTAETKKDCQRWLRTVVNKDEMGFDFNKSKVMYDEFIRNWLISAKPSLQPRTWSQYNQLARDHIIPYLGKIKMIELTAGQIQSLYDRRLQHGVGPRTVQLVHAVIHRSLNHAVKIGVLSRNPDDATIPPKPKKKEMAFFDEDQVQLFLIVAQANQPRFFPLYRLAVTTGMRQGELLGLKWDDVDWVRRDIHVRRQVRTLPSGGLELAIPKTMAGKRKITIDVETLNILKTHQRLQIQRAYDKGSSWNENNLVFPNTVGNPMWSQRIISAFMKILNDAGLPKIRFHDLRHTAASLMLNNGIPVLAVSQRLGHARPSITLDIYGHLIPSQQEAAAELISSLVTPITLENYPRITHEK